MSILSPKGRLTTRERTAGGALRACDSDLLPEPEDRNGRHLMRVELGTTLMKFAFKISVQLWSRSDGSVVPLP